jgi:hypothetical protein
MKPTYFIGPVFCAFLKENTIATDRRKNDHHNSEQQTTYLAIHSIDLGAYAI